MAESTTPFEPIEGPTRPDYLGIMMEECDGDTWARVCAVAKEQALEGDRHARRWLSKYLIEMGTLEERLRSIEDFIKSSESGRIMRRTS